MFGAPHALVVEVGRDDANLEAKKDVMSSDDGWEEFDSWNEE